MLLLSRCNTTHCSGKTNAANNIPALPISCPLHRTTSVAIHMILTILVSVISCSTRSTILWTQNHISHHCLQKEHLPTLNFNPGAESSLSSLVAVTPSHPLQKTAYCTLEGTTFQFHSTLGEMDSKHQVRCLELTNLFVITVDLTSWLWKAWRVNFRRQKILSLMFIGDNTRQASNLLHWSRCAEVSCCCSSTNSCVYSHA